MSTPLLLAYFLTANALLVVCTASLQYTNQQQQQLQQQQQQQLKWPWRIEYHLDESAELCRRAVLRSLKLEVRGFHYKKDIAPVCEDIRVVPGPHHHRKTPSTAAEGGREPISSRRRSKREIYGADTRKRVQDRLYRQHPFASAVKLSTGCTGGLLSPHHVLTAAHCLHIDGDYRTDLRVGEPETLADTRERLGSSLRGLAPLLRSYRWHGISKLQASPAWIDRTRTSFADYSLVTMNPDECITTSYMKMQPMSVSSLRNLVRLGRQVVQFTSFSDDKPKATLWYRQCGITHVDGEGMIFYDCDATFGSSGAAIYVYVVLRDPVTGRRTYRRRIIGINSGNRVFRDASGTTRRLNVATGITPQRYREICSWAPDMCDIPDYQDRRDSDSWVMSCGGSPPPPTTAPMTSTVMQLAETTFQPTAAPSEATIGKPAPGSNSTAEQRSDDLMAMTVERDGLAETSTRQQPTTVTTAVTTTTNLAPTEPPTQLTFFMRLCLGLGKSLRDHCIRRAKQAAAG